jgi:hypothetical protein
VRLDHLLSKEHWHPLGCPGSPPRPTVLVGVAHGWIIDYLASRTAVRRRVLVFFLPFLGGGGPWEAGGLWWVVSGTLLGPEGSDASSAFLWASPVPVPQAPPFLGGCCWRGPLVGCRPYFENYTVDASIFVSIICGPKILRAHGGCLGTRNR